MKYWVFQNNQVSGPFNKEQVSQVRDFSGETLVCPEGRKGTEMGDWQRVEGVPELAEALLKGPRVAAAARDAGERPLPPEPTLRDLAVLGTIQERTSLLENAIHQLQEDMRARDTEISRLKVELAAKERDSHELQGKLAEVEGRVGALSTLKDDLAKDERQIQDIQDKLLQAREELKRELSRAAEEERQIQDIKWKLEDGDRRIQDLQIKVERPPVAAAAPVETGPTDLLGEPVDIAAEARPRKKGSRLLLAVVVLAGAGTAGLYFGAPYLKKPQLSAVPAPTLQIPQEPAPAPEPTPTPPPAPEPVDLSQIAADLVKNQALPGTRETLGARLERVFPPNPKGNLSSWMVEPIAPDRFQVTYYANRNKLVYQFLTRPQDMVVQGVNPEAIAVLNGEMPAAPAPKRVRKPKRGPKPAEPALSLDEEIPGGSSSAATPPAAAPEEDEQRSLDELLLPGVPKPKKRL